MTCMNQAVLWSLRLLGAWVCALGWSSPVQAQSPNSDPCETIHVYRLQPRMPFPTDADGRPFVSLQEGNASDATAFRGLLNATAPPSWRSASG